MSLSSEIYTLPPELRDLLYGYFCYYCGSPITLSRDFITDETGHMKMTVIPYNIVTKNGVKVTGEYHTCAAKQACFENIGHKYIANTVESNSFTNETNTSLNSEQKEGVKY